MLLRLRALCYHTTVTQFPENCAQFISQFKVFLRDKVAEDREKLDQWVYVNVPSLSIDDLKDVFGVYHSAHTQGYPLSPTLASCFLKEVEIRVSQNPLSKWTLISLAAEFQGMLSAAGVDLHARLVALSQGTETEEELLKEDLSQIAERLAALTALTENFKDAPQLITDKKLIFSAAERVLAPIISPQIKLGFNHFCDVLFSSVKLNWGSEKFRRDLESLVFSRLELIKIRQKVALAEIYRHRIFTDLQYMQDLHAKYTDMLGNSLSVLHPSDFTRIITALSTPFRNPVYSSEQFTTLLENLVSYPLWGRNRDPLENIQARHALLSYLVTIGHPAKKNVYEQICQYLLTNMRHFPPEVVLKFADDFADAKYFNSGFWDLFLANPLRFALIPGSLNIWVRIMRKLKFINPPLYENLQRLPEMQMAEGKLRQTAESMLQAAIEWRGNSNLRKTVATFLKQANCEFNELTVAEFLVDFTIPSKKLAIDACYQRSFVLPSMNPVARLSIKKEILERQGWTYLPLPCFSGLDKDTWRDKLLRSLQSDKTHL